ncbi:Zn clus multi-domain protein [Pyrenophora teres f. maculata]|nr:Zn clus multi-domain protein [Pyrenophora teres f. maculata]
MFPHQGGQGQLPTHWQPPTSQQPANGSYAQPPHMNTTLPPPPPQEPRPDMAQHPQYQQQQPYRLPGPNEWTRAPPPADPYRQQPPPPPQYVQQHHQPPAPRQRTAIACRYCRRRKIRCSGFEATEDGRCSNCMRFNQDCIFTPVSAQTQAFVPAHTVWRGVGQPPPMYGAYGQPLPPASHGEPYGQGPSRQQQQYLPSPTAGPYPAHSDYGPSSASPDEASREALIGRKRLHPEPHTPTLPPPQPGSALQAPHRGTGPEYAYPEPPSLTSSAPTANAPTPYSSGPPPTQPYYAAQPPRQGSPQSAYRYEPSRASSSPQSQAPATPGAPPTPYYGAPPQANGVLQPPPPRSDGRTPPPPTSQASSSRPSMRINDLVSDNGPARSSTDSSMLNMLNRRPM